MTGKEVSFIIKAKDQASAALKQVERAAGGVIERFISVKAVLGAATGALAGLSFAVLVKDMLDLGAATEKAFRQMAANLPTGIAGLNELRESIRALADESGRAISEMQEAAVEITHLGVSDAGEVQSRLRAATMLADATGADLKTTIGSLDQILDTFNLSGNEALEMFARIRSASKGRVDVESIFDAFRTVAPVVQKLGLDADTTTRALVALLDRGLDAKAIRGKLTAYDADTIRQLAREANISTTALQEMQKEAELVRSSSDAASQVLKNQFSKALQDLGVQVLPTVNTYLRGTVALLETIRDGNWKAVWAGFFGDREALEKAIGNSATAKLGPIQWTNLNQPLDKPPPKRAPLPLTPEERKAIDDAAIAVAKYNAELEKLAKDTKDADDRTHELAVTAGQKLAQAIDQSLGELTGHGAEAAARAINERIALLGKEVLANDALSAAEKDRLLSALQHTRELQQLENSFKPIFDRADLTLQSIGTPGHSAAGDLAALMDLQQQLLSAQKELNRLGGDDSDIKKKLLDIEKKRADVVKDLGAATRTVTQSAEEHTRAVLDSARALQQAVDGALQLADAFGLVDHSTTNILRSVGQMAAQVPVLMDQISNLRSGASDKQGNPLATLGSVAAAALPVIGGVATLATSVLGLGKSSDQARQQLESLRQSLDRTFLSLSEQVYGTQSLTDVLARNAREYADARREIETSLAGSGQEIARNQRLADLKVLEEERNRQLTEEYNLRQKEVQEDYEIRRLRALGLNDEADALAEATGRQREYAKAVKDGANDATLAALQLTQALEEQAAATRKSNDEFFRQADAAWQAVLAARAQAQQAAQAEAEALDRQRSALSDMLGKQSKAVTSALQVQAKAAHEQQKFAESALRDTTTAVERLHEFRVGLDIGDLTTLDPKGQKDAAEAQMRALFAAAQGGDKQAAADFGGAATTFLQLSRGFNASGQGFVSDENTVKRLSDELLAQYGAQQTVAQQMLDAASSQVELLEQQLDAVQTAAETIRDAIATASGNQIGALNSAISGLGGILTTTIASATTTGAAPASPSVSPANAAANGLVASLVERERNARQAAYADYLAGGGAPSDGAAIDAYYRQHMEQYGGVDAGAEFQKYLEQQREVTAVRHAMDVRRAAFADYIDGGGNADDDAAFAAYFNEYFGSTPQFALGGQFDGGVRLVGEMGPELEFTGPARILSNTQTRELLAGAFGGGQSSADVRDEMTLVRQVLQEGFKQAIASDAAMAQRLDENTAMLRRVFERLPGQGR